MAEERVVNDVSMGRRESGSESCFQTEVGSLRVADRRTEQINFFSPPAWCAVSH